MHDAVPLLHDYLEHAAARLPDKIALVHAGQRLAYRALERQANALAHALVAQGVSPGDRVLVFGDNVVETAVAFWAVLKANAVVSMISPLTKADKLRYLIDDCRPAVLIAGAQLHPVWGEPARSPHLKRVIVFGGPLDPATSAATEHLLPWPAALASGNPDAPPPRSRIDIDLAAIIYTSGSTGEPKGVMLTHRNMLTAATSIATYLCMRESDVVLCALPLSFDYGLYQMILAFRQGARLVLERSFTYPLDVVRRMAEEGVTGFPGVPTMFAMLAELKALRDYDLSPIRFVTNTAAALPFKHIGMLRTLFPDARIYSMYGLTECKRCTYLPPEDLERKPGSVGIAIPNTEMWIVDADGRRLPPGNVGELVIRGATVMKGYWEKPEATARRLKPGPLPGEQVLYTGDYCRMDEDGYLYFVGRMDDVIKSRGEKVAPKEVENVLFDMPGVREAAVIGVPDPILGQAVKAFVVPENGVHLTEQDVRRHCQARLESFAVPAQISFMTELPKTDTGKIRKRGLE